MKTTVVKGVLTSYELVLAILFRWRAWSCVRHIVWLWRSHVSGHRSDHHLLSSNLSLSSTEKRGCHGINEFKVIVTESMQSHVSKCWSRDVRIANWYENCKLIWKLLTHMKIANIYVGTIHRNVRIANSYENCKLIWKLQTDMRTAKQFSRFGV